jgi:alkanesulfonate monooxygenase SsuD/methylene tetrahydromethanopterin reductase-like flavin-dependent oxidoreductase (luciferase family)
MNTVTATQGREAAALLNEENRFKLAVFGANVSGGCSVTSAAGTIAVTWPESRHIAQLADRAGLDAMIPVARWRGFGGATNFNDRCFETFTWAAGVAAVTERIQVFATMQVPTLHPVRAAKEAATIDHISGGRFGLNLVAGWNEAEIRMFGLDQRPHDERYGVSDEWATVIKRAWAEQQFDFDGRYFQLPGVHSEPKPLQRPGPLIMSAGQSPAGSAFAARHADLQFIFLHDLARTGELVAGLKARALADYGRRLKVMSLAYVVCRDTEQEARDYYDYYVHEMGDWAAARNLVAGANQNMQSADTADPAVLEALVAGYGALPLVGTADQIVTRMGELAAAGLDGLTLSWVDYAAGISQYESELLPRLRAQGLRH